MLSVQLGASDSYCYIRSNGLSTLEATDPQAGRGTRSQAAASPMSHLCFQDKARDTAEVALNIKMLHKAHCPCLLQLRASLVTSLQITGRSEVQNRRSKSAFWTTICSRCCQTESNWRQRIWEMKLKLKKKSKFTNVFIHTYIIKTCCVLFS